MGAQERRNTSPTTTQQTTTSAIETGSTCAKHVHDHDGVSCWRLLKRVESESNNPCEEDSHEGTGIERKPSAVRRGEPGVDEFPDEEQGENCPGQRRWRPLCTRDGPSLLRGGGGFEYGLPAAM